MDLKSMLNSDSAAQKRPARLHTPHSSYDRSIVDQHYRSDSASDRQTPHPTSTHAFDSRASAPGSYFAFQSQSPQQQNSASTPSIGAQSVYAQSPSSHGHVYTPRDGATPHTAYPPAYPPPASPAAYPPTTPGAGQYYTSHQYPSAPLTYTPTQRSSPRESLNQTNGHSQPHVHHMSPPSYNQQILNTPLGPPTAYSKPPFAPTQRPPSQGCEHQRRESIDSVRSSHSRDFSAHPVPQPELGRGMSMQRLSQTITEDRERSMSVSPKTIPRQTPHRQSTGHSQPYFQETPATAHPPLQHPLSAHVRQYPLEIKNEGPPTRPPYPPQLAEEISHSVPYKTSFHSTEPGAHSNVSSRPSPGPQTASSMTPQSTHSSLPPQPSPPTVKKEPVLKRTLSTVSSGLPPRKRLRRDEVPVFAQSARRGRPAHLLRRNEASHRITARPRESTPRAEVHQATNGQPVLPAISTERAELAERPLGWEPTIQNASMMEDMTRHVCDWIYSEIGNKTPPFGAHFEIEAKIGVIMEQDDNLRLNLPVGTETALEKKRWKPVRFNSLMNMEQHKHLNGFLNAMIQNALSDQAAGKPRQLIHYEHSKETDVFFELTKEGMEALPQGMTHWINPKHALKVRRTYDEKGQQILAQIIKIRIADLEIFNPSCPFDYRISISLEMDWNDNPAYLRPARDSSERNKDRMSYKHTVYQIDLTQVGHGQGSTKEHELEVEIDAEAIKHEIENLQEQRPSNYQDYVKGFLDNVRLLCKMAGEVA